MRENLCLWCISHSRTADCHAGPKSFTRDPVHAGPCGSLTRGRPDLRCTGTIIPGYDSWTTWTGKCSHTNSPPGTRNCDEFCWDTEGFEPTSSNPRSLKAFGPNHSATPLETEDCSPRGSNPSVSQCKIHQCATPIFIRWFGLSNWWEH